MGSYRAAMAVGIALACISAVLSLIGPRYLGRITDLMAASISNGTSVDMDGAIRLGMMLIILYVTAFALSSAEHYLLPAVSERVANRMRRDLDRKFSRLPLGYFDGRSTGDLMSRVTNDADTVGGSFAESVSLMVTACTFLFGSAAMMFLISWKLAAVCVIPAILALLFVYLMVTGTQRFFRAQSRDLGRMNGHVEETYYAMDIVRAYNGREGSARRFGEMNSSLRRTGFFARLFSGMMPRIMEFLDNLSYVIVCVAGSYMIVSGEITYGTVVAFIVYVRHFTRPVAQIADAAAAMQSVAASAERVFEVLDAEEMPPDGDPARPEEVRGEVEFRDVRFSYVPGREVIRGFSGHVSPGMRVAIVGPTGAGKTTLANLLMRFYEMDSGDILVDGRSIKEMPRASVHDMFSMVLQDPWIFEGTVTENVAYNVDGVTDDEVKKACEDAGIDGFVRSLPEGYGTVLVPSALSAGQRQQLSVARAIVRDAPMLILDEATSSVDTRTEKRIQDAMDSLMRGRTSFVIAHRLTTIVNSDTILVVRDGNIAEQGTHAELLEKGGFYADLYRSQFEGCE